MRDLLLGASDPHHWSGGARDGDHLPGALPLGTFQQEHQPHLGWAGHGSAICMAVFDITSL